MKKRIFAMALIAVLLLTGCSSGRRETVEGRVEAPRAMETPEVTESVENENPLSLGRMEGGTYVNEYVGFGCDLDDSWVFYSAEELQAMPEQVKEAVSGSELGDALDAMSQFTDVMAENVDALVNFNVLYQKLSAQEQISNAITSEEALMDGILSIQDQMVDAYAQAGIMVQSMEKKLVTYLGKEAWAIYTVSEVSSVPYYMLQVYNYHLGAYGYTLTASSYLEDNTQTILDMVYPLD